MSWSTLMSGAECSTSSNPLNQMSKHVGQDKSLQRDRFAPASTPLQTMRSTQEAPQQARQMVQDFFRPDPKSNEFNFDQMRRELNNVHSPSPVPMDWAAAGIQPVQLTPEERARMETAFRTQPVPHAYQGLPGEFPSRSATEIVPQVGTMPDMRNFAMRFGMDSPPLFGPPVQPILDVKGNGKLMQLDDTKWEEQFRALADSIRDQETTKVEDFEQDSKKFLFEDVDQTPNDLFSGQGLDWDGTDLDFVDRFLEEPNSTFDGKPDLGEYMFEPENPWIFHEHPFEEGIRIMENGGSLSMAALAFELVCQLEPRRVEGWTLLGIVQAQNEKELAAIRACEQALRLDESNLDALMNLAVSYTNEGYDTAAYHTLEHWVTKKYPSLVPLGPLNRDSRSELRQHVETLFFKAAQMSSQGANIDADVQVGLGVLFYGDEEYDKAIDCFSAALSVQPNNHLLWNRYGATLANSGRSEEAIEAYQRALEIKPTFVRARYNLGVSCVNIGCYTEAAQHLLGALSMHQVEGDLGGGVNISSNLWETLRRVFLFLDRRDLAEKAASGVDVNIFREDFDF